MVEVCGGSGDEPAILQDFWNTYQDCASDGIIMPGFNINGFDLPFLVKRSWIRGVPVPRSVRRGRYWNDRIFVDLREQWTFGDRYGKGSLGYVCNLLGLGEKTEESGKDFHKLWEEDRARALTYLEQDCRLCEKLAGVFCVEDPRVSAEESLGMPGETQKAMAGVRASKPQYSPF